MVNPEKKSLWVITVAKEIDQKVVFNEEIDANEAIHRYMNDDYEDIIDEYDTGYLEAVDAH